MTIKCSKTQQTFSLNGNLSTANIHKFNIIKTYSFCHCQKIVEGAFYFITTYLHLFDFVRPAKQTMFALIMKVLE